MYQRINFCHFMILLTNEFVCQSYIILYNNTALCVIMIIYNICLFDSMEDLFSCNGIEQ